MCVTASGRPVRRSGACGPPRRSWRRAGEFAKRESLSFSSFLSLSWETHLFCLWRKIILLKSAPRRALRCPPGPPLRLQPLPSIARALRDRRGRWRRRLLRVGAGRRRRRRFRRFRRLRRRRRQRRRRSLLRFFLLLLLFVRLPRGTRPALSGVPSRALRDGGSAGPEARPRDHARGADSGAAAGEGERRRKRERGNSGSFFFPLTNEEGERRTRESSTVFSRLEETQETPTKLTRNQRDTPSAS